jgi:hypothetical protein
MCDPTVIAIGSLVLTAGSAVADHVGQAGAAKKNEKAALDDMMQMWTDVGLMQQEVQAQAAETVLESDRRAREAHATAIVSAGEANVSGVSVDALLSVLNRQGAEYRSSVNRQADRQVAQLQREKISGRTEAQNRIAAYPRPNLFATGLRIGGAAMDYATWKTAQKP